MPQIPEVSNALLLHYSALSGAAGFARSSPISHHLSSDHMSKAIMPQYAAGSCPPLSAQSHRRRRFPRSLSASQT